MTRPPAGSLATLAAAVDRLRDRPLALVGLGGHGCSGKSTLAGSLPDVTVVGTDEFWDGARFDLARLRREVIEPLRAGVTSRFRSFDWAASADAGERLVEPAGVVVIEGVCALHRMFRDAYDLRVWVETPRMVRLERAIHRDGPDARATWETVWMPMEDSYVARDLPVEAADLVVPGAEPGGG